MVGQLTVADLRAALVDEQDWALVAVDFDGRRSPLQLSASREKGRPVFMLEAWEPPDDADLVPRTST